MKQIGMLATIALLGSALTGCIQSDEDVGGNSGGESGSGTNDDASMNGGGHDRADANPGNPGGRADGGDPDDRRDAGPGPGPDGCAQNADCRDGQVCREGACVAAPDPCACDDVLEPACGADGVTYGNACEARCAGVESRPGECAPPPACADDADCGRGQVCRDGACEAPDCVCADIYDPVCGADGLTYGNACEARCAGVEFRPGECARPACRDDSECAPDEICVDGQCRAGGCICPDIYDPVCGADGRTYGNACEARCAGVESRPGECAGPACRVDDDCAILGPPNCEARCLDGVCGLECAPPGCGADADCAEGEACEAGVCVPGGCVCPDVYEPVCGTDGVTYGNACEARCARVESRPGECAGPACRVDGDCAILGPPNCEARCLDGVCGLECLPPRCGADADCAAGEICEAGACVPRGCGCPDVYAPVCGTNGHTYGNACEARCAGVEWRDGECPAAARCAPDRACPDDQWCDYPPDFACGGAAADALVPPSGLCRPRPDACAAILLPVCGCDGRSYDNACRAHGNGQDVAHEGACRPDCVPARETCNGLDDDCNGAIDDGARCDAGTICVEGACRPVDPALCEPIDCGPRPGLPNWLCEDGSVGGPTGRCLRNADGACGWEINDCPQPPRGCGARLGMTCDRDEYCDFPDRALCGATDQTGVCQPRPDVCERILAPVCGCDGQTYGNACVAAAAGTDVLHAGDCAQPICPVAECGEPPDVIVRICPDGSVGGFTGRCLPDAAGACGWEIRDCPADPQICGTRGAVACPRGTWCQFPIDAQCGATDLGGTCQPIPDGCIDLWDPVCGCDGRTYGNGCVAASNGVSVLYRGECRPTDPPECAAEACGPPLGLANRICWDGTVAGPTGRCLPGADGVCGWEVIDCPPDPAACDRADCGPMSDRPNVECVDGTIGGPTGRCLRDAAGACGWEIRECPAPAECTPEACGPEPLLPNEQCADGSLGGPTGQCLPDARGTCGWEIRACPPGPRRCGGLIGARCADGEWCAYSADALCGAADATGVCEGRPDSCVDAVVAVVCGCDGNSYRSPCAAHANGVSVASEGRCAL